MPDLICTGTIYLYLFFPQTRQLGEFFPQTRPPGRFFPQIDGKFSGHKNMNWKINTNRWYILNPANRRKKTIYRPKNKIQPIGTKNSANRREFSSSKKMILEPL